MKEIRVMLIFFAAFLAVQTSNAQAVHDEYIEIEGLMYCLDEPIIGQMHYRNILLFDKSGAIKKFIWVIENSWFVGAESGALYKMVDIGHATPDYIIPFPQPGDNLEFTCVNNMKIICKELGKVYSGRVHMNFVFDKEGNLISKKNINTTCF